MLAFVLGVASAFDAPARQSFVSEIVAPDDLTNAVGLNSASFNVARIVGPAVAGLSIAALGSGAVATGWVILANGLSYAAPILTLHLLDRQALTSPEPVSRAPGAIRAGVAYVRSRPDLMLILGIVFFTGTFGLNFQMTSALMATQVYGKGPTEFGLLGTFLAVGSLTGVAARRASDPGPAPAGRRRGDHVRRGRDRRRADAVVRAVRAAVPGDGPVRADHDHQRQRVHAAAHRPGNARPGDRAVHDDLHRRHADRGARSSAGSGRPSGLAGP